ncbi:MAG: hypothetical protein ABSF87_13675 [Xanthobacteraceae bacterium]|jgi:hypothetical protein
MSSVLLNRRRRSSQRPSEEGPPKRAPGARYQGFAICPAAYSGHYLALVVGHRIRDRLKIDIGLGEISVPAACTVLHGFGLTNLIVAQAAGDPLLAATAGLLNELKT